MRPLRDTRLKENVQAPDYDGFKDEYISEVSLQVTHERRHALLTGVSLRTRRTTRSSRDATRSAGTLRDGRSSGRRDWSPSSQLTAASTSSTTLSPERRMSPLTFAAISATPPEQGEEKGWTQEEHDEVVARLDWIAENMPGDVQLWSAPKVEKPWPKYDETHHNQIAARGAAR
jgi:hypothetical protein